MNINIKMKGIFKMKKHVKELVKISKETKVETPVQINGHTRHLDLRDCGYEYRMATYDDGDYGLYLAAPDGTVERDEVSLLGGKYAV